MVSNPPSGFSPPIDDSMVRTSVIYMGNNLLLYKSFVKFICNDFHILNSGSLIFNANFSIFNLEKRDYLKRVLFTNYLNY